MDNMVSFALISLKLPTKDTIAFELRFMLQFLAFIGPQQFRLPSGPPIWFRAFWQIAEPADNSWRCGAVAVPPPTRGKDTPPSRNRPEAGSFFHLLTKARPVLMALPQASL